MKASQPADSSGDDNRRKGTCYDIKGVQYVVLVVVTAVLSIMSSSKLTAKFDYGGGIRFDMIPSEDPQNTTSSQSSIKSISVKKTPDEIQVLLPREQIEWMKNRTDYFQSFYEIPFNQPVEEKLHAPADNLGPVLDFMVVGMPKCGTTTLMANLALIAPMPQEADVCTPPRRTVLYAYKNWPKKFGGIQQSNTTTSITTIANSGKLFRSSKCPMFVEEGWIEDICRFLPKTKLIIGIRVCSPSPSQTGVVR